jgi:hypothetical protein
MNQQRRVARLERVEQRQNAIDRVGCRERGGREREAHRAAVEERVGVACSRAVERDRAPHAERLAEAEDAVVPSVEERLRLRTGQRLDPERAREAHERTVDPVRAQRGTAADGVVRRGVERGGRLAGQHELAAVQKRRRRPLFESGQKWVGPQVLMNVDTHGAAIIPIKPTDFMGNRRSVIIGPMPRSRPTSILSIASERSVLSIGSVGSVLSIGSVGSAASVLSIGSIGSLASIFSSGSVASICSAGSVGSILSAGSVGGMRAAGRGRSRERSGTAAVAAVALLAALALAR